MRRPFLSAIGAIGAACFLFALLLELIDPYDIYPWGVRPKLKMNGDYSAGSSQFLAAVVAKTPSFDTIFLGGSTARPYTPQMMEEILPGTRSAFNLSYAAPSPADRTAVLRQLLKFSHARRLILEADWTYVLPKALQHPPPGFPMYLYDAAWWNDIRGLSKEAFQLSKVALQGDVLWLTAWSRHDEELAYRKQYEITQSEAVKEEYRSLIARNKVSVNTSSELTCRSMDAISEDLVPFTRAFVARGVEVDVVLPPYSWVFYYWAKDAHPRGLDRPILLNDVLQMRRCLVQALADLPHVRVFAFDNIPGLASDWKNYFDPGHLYNSEASRYILRSIAEGRNVLSKQNIDADIAQLRSNVVRYEFRSNEIWTPEK